MKLTVVLYKREETESSTNSVEWQTKLSVQGNVGEGEYFVEVYCETTCAASNRVALTRVLIDGVERAFDYHRPITADLYKASMMMGELHLNEGNHSATLQFRVNNGDGTAKIRRARLRVTKH